MKQFKKLLLYYLLLFVFQPAVAGDVPSLSNISYNVDIDYESDDSNFIKYNSVIRDDYTSITGNQSPNNITNTRGSHIIGYHQTPEGREYFLFDAGVSLGPYPDGNLVTPYRIVKNKIMFCGVSFPVENCHKITSLLVGNDPLLRPIKINAFTLVPNSASREIIFSVESAVQINGFDYFPSDLIRHDRFTDIYTLEFDSLNTSVGGNIIGPTKNIDAISRLPNNNYILSFADDGELTNFSYTKSDIILMDFTNDSMEVFYSPSHFGDSKHNVNVTSLMHETPIISDVLFSDGFEE